jgi:hypothetical protein
LSFGIIHCFVSSFGIACFLKCRCGTRAEEANLFIEFIAAVLSIPYVLVKFIDWKFLIAKQRSVVIDRAKLGFAVQENTTAAAITAMPTFSCSFSQFLPKVILIHYRHETPCCYSRHFEKPLHLWHVIIYKVCNSVKKIFGVLSLFPGQDLSG